MKQVYRYEDNSSYWDRRWSEAGRDQDRFTDLTIYPIKYAEMVVTDKNERVAELGCGLGRVVKHYHYQGYNIAGLERSAVAVERLKSEDETLDVRVGDVLNLPYEDETFDVVLAFGLYHNIESRTDLERALKETARCIKPNGRFCISMRPNNIEMHANEMYWNWKQRHNRKGERTFHKWLVGESEFSGVLRRLGLQTQQIHRARNVSILYRMPWLQARQNNEGERRAAGYRLNAAGRVIDRALVKGMPGQFCNVLVYIGRKTA